MGIIMPCDDLKVSSKTYINDMEPNGNYSLKIVTTTKTLISGDIEPYCVYNETISIDIDNYYTDKIIQFDYDSSLPAPSVRITLLDNDKLIISRKFPYSGVYKIHRDLSSYDGVIKNHWNRNAYLNNYPSTEKAFLSSKAPSSIGKYQTVYTHGDHYSQRDNIKDWLNEDKSDWELYYDYQTYFHQLGKSIKPYDPYFNNKYVNTTTGEEVVYNSLTGQKITDSLNMGTYNYSNDTT